jgi:hypothetical protein
LVTPRLGQGATGPARLLVLARSPRWMIKLVSRCTYVPTLVPVPQVCPRSLGRTEPVEKSMNAHFIFNFF